MPDLSLGAAARIGARVLSLVSERLPRPAPWRVFVPVLLLIVLLASFGGAPGALLALCLLPRLLRPFPENLNEKGETAEAPPWVDLCLALGCGLIFGLVSGHILGPALLTGGSAHSSDTAEHFWLLHSLENPSWAGWSANRYPLPALLVHLVTTQDYPFQAWFQAATLSMILTGAGLYLWGRALLSPAAGLVSVILALCFPELVLFSRTASAYPEILAIWTLGCASTAWALRSPSVARCVVAAFLLTLTFASDARGLLPGLGCLPVLLLACLRLWIRGRRQGAALSALALVLFLSLGWFAQRSLPVKLVSLETMLHTSLQVSFERAGLPQPERMEQADEGWIWGRSNPLELPKSYRRIRRIQSQMNTEILGDSDLGWAREHRIRPLLIPSLLLASLGLILGRGARGPIRSARAWIHWLDPWGRAALLTTVPGLSLLLSVWTFEYAERYLAMAWPSLIVLAGVGLVAIGGMRRPVWASILIALALLFLLPGDYRLNATWRVPFGAQGDLFQCLQAAQGLSTGALAPPVENCARAQARPLRGALAWPWP